MAAKWQRFKIDISEYDLKPKERKEVADLVVERIFERTTQENKDKEGKKFPGYSKSYSDSLDFKIGGKSKSNVDLQLSGDMLAAIRLLSDNKNQLMIGFENGTDENARADGNIRGTYGKKQEDAKKKRDFLGISDRELSKIIKFVKSNGA